MYFCIVVHISINIKHARAWFKNLSIIFILHVINPTSLYIFLRITFYFLLMVGMFNLGVTSVDDSSDDPCMKTAEGVY